jgi:hypothetical protein
LVMECMDTEFRAYMALPDVKTDELEKWFINGSPAYKEIVNLLNRHRDKGWVLTNPLNPSTKRLMRIVVKKMDAAEAIVHSTEYWYLRWWNTREGSYAYPYRETNRQIYILKKASGTWKVYENLRPPPRSSAPHRRKKS